MTDIGIMNKLFNKRKVGDTSLSPKNAESDSKSAKSTKLATSNLASLNMPTEPDMESNARSPHNIHNTPQHKKDMDFTNNKDMDSTTSKDLDSNTDMDSNTIKNMDSTMDSTINKPEVPGTLTSTPKSTSTTPLEEALGSYEDEGKKINQILGISEENASSTATGEQILGLAKLMLGIHKTIKENNCELKAQNETLKEEVKNLKFLNSEKDKQIDELRIRIEKLEAYSRYPNVVVSNIPETEGENLFNWFHDTFLKKADLYNKGPSIQTIHLDKIHRIGYKPVQRPSSPSPPQPRKILIRLSSHRDKDRVMKTKQELRKHKIFIDHHYTPELEQQRKPLYPIAAIARKKGYRATVIDNYLLINGRRYTIQQLNLLPTDLQDARFHCIRTPKQVSFLGFRCPLSNFYKCTFTYHGQTYTSTEQFIQITKASLFPGNDELIKQMTNQHDPLKLKNLGQKVSNFNKKTWSESAEGLLYGGLKQKFIENDDCLDFLDSTGNKLIVEASPTDRLFGIGRPITFQGLEDTTTHQGTNIQGHMLMNIRQELLYQEHDSHEDYDDQCMDIK